MQTATRSDERHLLPRPRGPALLHQRWAHLAFLHWPLEPRHVQPLLPRSLEVETFDGAAWVGAAAFRVSRMHPALLPPIPLVGDALELNFRTYVRHADVPGVWFFALDATNPLAVISARLAFRLPYYLARIDYALRGRERSFRAQRTHPSAPPMSFEATWTLGDPLPPTVPGTLDHFLVERYRLYAADGDRLWCGRIQHERWPLRRAQPHEAHTTLFAAHGLPTPREMPLMHAQREPLHVEAWPLRRVRAQ